MQHAADAKHCRRCGAPYRYDAVYLGHLGRYHCDNCGAHRPEPGVAATDVVLEGVSGARFTLRTPAGERPIVLPLPGLYNVYNALAAAALSLALGASLDDIAAGLHAVSPAFGRAETVRLGGRDLSILLVKNPAGANEVLRTLALEPGEHDLLAILNDQVADGRDVSWVWDADFEVLADARAARDLQRHPRGGDGAAAEVRGRADGADRGRDRPRRGPRPGARHGDGRLFALPTYTAMLGLRDVLVARGAAGAASRERRPAAGRARARGHLARRRVRRLRRGPAAVARPRDQPRRPGARRRRRDRPRGARPRRARATGSSRSTAIARPARRAARRARPACRSRPSRADARDFDLGERRFGLILVPMQTVQLLGGPDGRAPFLRRARAALAPGGLLAIAIADALETFDEVRCLPPIPDIREIDGIVYASRPVAVTRGARRRGHPPRPRDGRHRRAPHRRGGPHHPRPPGARGRSRPRARPRASASAARGRSRRPTSTSARRW